MNYPKTALLRAAADEQGRYSMQHVLFDDGKLIATNGKILVLLPVTECDDDEPGIIPRQAIELAHSGGTPAKGCRLLSGDNGHVRAQNRDHTLTDVARPEDVEFPRWKDVVPVVDRETHLSIGLDAGLLVDLLQALGAKGFVALHVPRDGKSPVVVQPEKDPNGRNAEPEASGIIMPIALDE